MHPEFTSLLGQVSAGENLSRPEMTCAMGAVMSGHISPAQIGLLLSALAAKGETAAEVAGAATALRAHMTPIRSRHAKLLDTCGTGGGGSTTFNISTSAALVIAAAGVPLAKHGNRSVTSKSGSADALAELGVNIQADVPQVQRCLDELGICFCFAPLMHPAMKHVAAVRQQLGIRTIFNLLGPLANPAGASCQLLGVGLPELRPLVASALCELGTERALVVAGEDGLGEVTLAGTTHVTQIEAGQTTDFAWSPPDFGLSTTSLETLHISTPAHSAHIIRGVLAGQPGPARDIVVLNAAAGLLAAGHCPTPTVAAAQAAAAIDSGAAEGLLHNLAAMSHQPAP